MLVLNLSLHNLCEGDLRFPASPNICEKTKDRYGNLHHNKKYQILSTVKVFHHRGKGRGQYIQASPPKQLLHNVISGIFFSSSVNSQYLAFNQTWLWDL
jgi:hypothetical protein